VIGPFSRTDAWEVNRCVGPLAIVGGTHNHIAKASIVRVGLKDHAKLREVTREGPTPPARCGTAGLNTRHAGIERITWSHAIAMLPPSGDDLMPRKIRHLADFLLIACACPFMRS
jgi:hypothetical protein